MISKLSGLNWIYILNKNISCTVAHWSYTVLNRLFSTWCTLTQHLAARDKIRMYSNCNYLHCKLFFHHAYLSMLCALQTVLLTLASRALRIIYFPPFLSLCFPPPLSYSLSPTPWSSQVFLSLFFLFVQALWNVFWIWFSAIQTKIDWFIDRIHLWSEAKLKSKVILGI